MDLRWELPAEKSLRDTIWCTQLHMYTYWPSPHVWPCIVSSISLIDWPIYCSHVATTCQVVQIMWWKLHRSILGTLGIGSRTAKVTQQHVVVSDWTLHAVMDCNKNYWAMRLKWFSWCIYCWRVYCHCGIEVKENPRSSWGIQVGSVSFMQSCLRCLTAAQDKKLWRILNVGLLSIDRILILAFRLNSLSILFRTTAVVVRRWLSQHNFSMSALQNASSIFHCSRISA